MIPIPLAGIAITGSALLAKYTSSRRNQGPAGANHPGAMPLQIQLPPSLKAFLDANPLKALAGTNPLRTLAESSPFRALAESNPLKALAENNPLQSVLGGLSSAVSQLTKGLTGEDYTRIVKEYLPADAVLINPRHLSNSGELGLSDLDGDSQDELLASYRTGAGVGTLVLKKDKDQWYKLADLMVPGATGLDFRDTSNISGSNRQQLLLGFPAEGKTRNLHAYTLENGTLKKLFEQKCSRFEVLPAAAGEAALNKQDQLAFWNRSDEGAYKVDLVRWNGLQLEPVKSKEKYYLRKVIPYHAYLVRSNPQHAPGWLNLADVLAEAGYTDDARIAIDTGMGVDRNGTYQEKFLELRKLLD